MVILLQFLEHVLLILELLLFHLPILSGFGSLLFSGFNILLSFFKPLFGLLFFLNFLSLRFFFLLLHQGLQFFPIFLSFFLSFLLGLFLFVLPGFDFLLCCLHSQLLFLFRNVHSLLESLLPRILVRD